MEKLVNIGLVDRIEFADGTHHYRVCGSDHHHHLTCTQCHRIIEVKVCLPTDQLTAIENQMNFDIEGHSLTFFLAAARTAAFKGLHPSRGTSGRP